MTNDAYGPTLGEQLDQAVSAAISEHPHVPFPTDILITPSTGDVIMYSHRVGMAAVAKLAADYETAPTMLKAAGTLALHIPVQAANTTWVVFS